MDTSEPSPTPYRWYYRADCGHWHLFEDDPDCQLTSMIIETYYLRNPRGILKSSSSGQHFEIDFSAMLRTNLKTGRKMRITRDSNVKTSCSCFSVAPVFWEMVDPTCPYQLIRLNKLTPEYQTVVNYVKKDGLLDRPIVSVSRIQNLDLWELYCRKKQQLMRIHGVTEIQERRLFHGTDAKNVETICKYNFDVRLAGQHGHSYGKGIYFAKHATFADKYSSKSKNPLPQHGGGLQNVCTEATKIIFLARVMIGTPKAGASHFLKPDHDRLENLHNSCVDDIKHPNIFVIFDPNQIFPEYVIQYK
ncbi:protein mono-ADP-ribosyltransferase PARP11 [Xyrichtys novacula]|uniref:Poly [ADP-ribose] polymerase n=1 Tax=Xyrichtys novacula TaxID=13765 RepID=A0AAV1F1F8_XYRNO|nr:protein mono-ADP-ribosyltransferase PARP11 [Xyrichtys novacula]